MSNKYNDRNEICHKTNVKKGIDFFGWRVFLYKW